MTFALNAFFYSECRSSLLSLSAVLSLQHFLYELFPHIHVCETLSENQMGTIKLTHLEGRDLGILQQKQNVIKEIKL